MTENHHRKHIIPQNVFYAKFFKNIFFSLLIILGSLAIGVFGYHYAAKLSWLDSLLNASMILTGMGQIDALPNDSAKWFASFYAIYSGVVFLTTIAITFAPLIHRFFHIFHLDEGGK